MYEHFQLSNADYFNILECLAYKWSLDIVWEPAGWLGGDV